MLSNWPKMCLNHRSRSAALLNNIDASNILPLQMAECLLQAQPDSVASHITARLIYKRI